MKDDEGQGAGAGPGPDELGLWASKVGMDGHRAWLQQRHDAIRAAGRARLAAWPGWGPNVDQLVGELPSPPSVPRV